MSDGCQIDDKGQRNFKKTKKTDAVGADSGQSISLEPKMVPLDPSIQIPAGYKPKCIAFANKGDLTLAFRGGHLGVVVNEDCGSFPELILQPIWWRAKKSCSYQYIQLDVDKFTICVGTEQNHEVDDARYASGNYFRMTLPDEYGEIHKALEGFQACWSRCMVKGNEK